MPEEKGWRKHARVWRLWKHVGGRRLEETSRRKEDGGNKQGEGGLKKLLPPCRREGGWRKRIDGRRLVETERKEKRT